MTVRPLLRTVLSAVVTSGIVSAAASSCSGDGTASPVGLAQPCATNTDCDAPLVCIFSRCHSACEISSTCPAGERCVSGGGSGVGVNSDVCQLPIEAVCRATSACESGQLCGSDHQCRAPCSATRACPGGSTCLPTKVTNGASACYASSNAADAPALVEAGVPGT